MEDITAAIMHAIEAGKLRRAVRQHGETGLAGLLRLADRHSLASAMALGRVTGESGDCALPGLRALGSGVTGAREL